MEFYNGGMDSPIEDGASYKHGRFVGIPLGNGTAIATAITLLAGLSPAETSVLRRMAEGCSNRAIAAELSLSVRTVEAHIRSIILKLVPGSRMDDFNRRVCAVLVYLQAQRTAQ